MPPAMRSLWGHGWGVAQDIRLSVAVPVMRLSTVFLASAYHCLVLIFVACSSSFSFPMRTAVAQTSMPASGSTTTCASTGSSSSYTSTLVVICTAAGYRE